MLNVLENFNIDSEFEDFEYDLFIISLGAEERGLHFFETTKVTAASYISIVEDGIPREIEGANRTWSFNNGFEPISVTEVAVSLKRIEKKCSGNELRVLVDISSISRKSMSILFSWLFFHRSSPILNLDVVYTIAKFSPPPNKLFPNSHIEEVCEEFAGWSTMQTAPTSLLLGLGYEPCKAEGASEFFDAKEQWVFIPKSKINDYLPVIEENNKFLLLRSRGEKQTIEYDVQDPASTFGQLENVISGLVERSNPVLMPFGPKLFFFLSLVQSYCHPEVGVWRVSGESSEVVINKEPSNFTVGVRLQFEL